MKTNIESLVEEALKEINNVSIDANQVRKILTTLAIKASQNGLQQELEKLKEELETERISHAGCGVAALGYFDGCDPKYLSASLQDVITLRKKYEELLNNQPPDEWWMGLKEGDKIQHDDGSVHVFDGMIAIGTDTNKRKYEWINLDNLSPYTEPTAIEQFMNSLTPEQLELAKSLKIEEIVKQNKT